MPDGLDMTMAAQRAADFARAAARPLAPTPPNPYFRPQGRSAQDPSQFALQGGVGRFVGRDGQIGSRLPTTEARNVLAGQPMDTNTTMRPLNLPGYTMVGNQMVPNSRLPQPSTANVPNKGLGGMTPNAFRTVQQAIRNGTTPPVSISPEAQSILAAQARAAANPYNANGLTSFQQTSLNRMARRRGVRGGDVRAWIQQSPSAQANMQAFQARNNTLPARPPAPAPAGGGLGGSLLASSGLPAKLGSDTHSQLVDVLRRYKAAEAETDDDPVSEADNLRTLRNQSKKTLDPQARGFFGGKVAECDDCQKPGTGGTNGEVLCPACGESPCECSAIKKLAQAAARL